MTLKVKITAMPALLLFAAVSWAEQAKNVNSQYRHVVIAGDSGSLTWKGQAKCRRPTQSGVRHYQRLK